LFSFGCLVARIIVGEHTPGTRRGKVDLTWTVK